MCHIRGERSEMPSNYHNEAGPSFSRLSYECESRNEFRALSFTANPKKFLNADTFFFVEPWACGPLFKEPPSTQLPTPTNHCDAPMD